MTQTTKNVYGKVATKETTYKDGFGITYHETEVIRTKNNLDRRQVLIKITSNGKNIINKKPSLLQKDFLVKFNKLQKWEQHLLLSSVERISTMMKRKTYLKD